MDRIENIGIIIGIPLIGRPVAPEWALTLACLVFPTGCTYKIVITKGLPIDEARNGLVELAQKENSDYVFFLDDDVMPPVDVLKHLYPVLAKDKNIGAVAGIYPAKTNPPEPMVYKQLGKGPFYNWKYGEIFEVEGIATGCMLINMEVFKKIPKPWFKTEAEDPNGKPRPYNITDDLYFCNKALEAGFKLMAHGGVICSQWDIDVPPDYYPKKYELTDFLPKVEV